MITAPNANLKTTQNQVSRSFFLPRLLLTLIILVIFQISGKALISPTAPAGIISFEFAGSLVRAREILLSWNEQARLLAAFSLGLDYLFMLAYASTISIACRWSGAALRRRDWSLSSAGRPLAWAQWVAALLDAIENLGLTLLLLGWSSATLWPALAAWAAGIKFSLVGIGLLYSAYGALAWLFPRRVNGPRDETASLP